MRKSKYLSNFIGKINFIHIHTVNVGINIKKTRLVGINDYGYGVYDRCDMFLVSYQSR